MPRVVCPMCHTGFEANLSRDNYALNCVACGVAFSAAQYLSREDYAVAPKSERSGSASTASRKVEAARVVKMAASSAAPVLAGSTFAKPASDATRTGGLPFMSETPQPSVRLTSAPAANTEKSKPAPSLQTLRDKLQTIRVKYNEEQPKTAAMGSAAQPQAPKASQEPVSPPVPAAQSMPVKVPVPEPELVLGNSADECPVPLQLPVKPAEPAKPVAIEAVVTKAKPEVSIEKIAKEHEAQNAVPAAKDAEERKNPGEKPRKKSRRPLLEGSFGPYEIEGEIARGGVGAVFKARERGTGRQVALKVLLDGEEAGEAERERFRHECETAKALSLPGMVQVYEVGELEQRPYMAMELVNGRSLDKVIPEKALSVNDCLILMKSVAETIGALHEAGYVHRDLKPGNILIDSFGSPKVADFGLVKSLDEITRMTASGLVCGTPAYMSPEQARGDGKAVDPRSDVWALGAVLYEMLSARPPFQAENALRLMLKITKDQPKPLRSLNLKVPEDVQYIVTKCLEKSAEKRYPTARAMAADIGRFLNSEPLEIRSQPRFENLERIQAVFAENKRSVLSVAGAAVAVILIGFLAHSFFSPVDPSALVDRGCKALTDTSLRPAERVEIAERFFREAVSLNPKNGKACKLLALCMGRESIDSRHQIVDPAKLTEARSMTLKAGELDSHLVGECRAQLARFDLWADQRVDEAREWEQAVAFAPNNLRYREALGLAYWNAGRQTNATQYYSRALNEFKNISKADPSYPHMKEYIQLLQERFLSNPVVLEAVTLNNHTTR